MVALHRRLAFIHKVSTKEERLSLGGVFVQKMKLGILLVVAVIALVSVASALPTSVDTDVSWPGPNSYFRVHILTTTPAGDADLPPGWYDGMCMDYNTVGIGGNVYQVYDSRTVNPALLPLSIQTVNWKKVNWVANNLNTDWKITQAALWRLDGAGPTTYPENSVLGSAPSYLYHGALPINSLDSYYPQIAEFVPSQPHEWYAVILVDGLQTIVIRVEIPEDEHQAPEFPTLALPVAMLIGVAGAVEYIRTKKE